MPTYYYLHAYRDLEKCPPAPFGDCEDVDCLLIETSRTYPELADGLEIGSVYKCDLESVAWYRGARMAGTDYHLERVCNEIARMVTGGKELDGRYSPFGWCDALSDLVASHKKWSSEEGKGPFWELLRFAHRGLPFGPAACKKLVGDFDRWDGFARLHQGEDFYECYKSLRECFSYPNEAGAVRFDVSWFDLSGNRLRESLLGSELRQVAMVDAE